MDGGILVGISGSSGTNPGAVDLSNPSSTTTDTIYEVWNYDNAPENTLFDLDMQTLVFEPRIGGGFDSYIHPGAQLPLPDLLIGTSFSKAKGDGVYDRRKASKRQTVVQSHRVFTTKTAKAALVMQNDGGSAAHFSLMSKGDQFPRMKVIARIQGGANISAALKGKGYSTLIAPGASVRVYYRLKTDRFYAGVLRDGNRMDTVDFTLSSGSLKDTAAMTVKYGLPSGPTN